MSGAPDPALLFDHAGVGIALIDQRGVVLRANAVLEAMLGRPSAELVGRPLALHLLEGEHASHAAILAELEHRGLSHRGLERRYRSAAGDVIVVREVVSSSKAGAAVVLQDVTALWREERERCAQRCLAHLGEMASVVAHEVRNALAGVGSAVEVIGQGFSAGSEERLAVEEVRRRVTDLSAMSRDLVRMARARPLRRFPTSVRVLLAGVARKLAPTRLEVSGADAEVAADVEILAMALLHLITTRARAGTSRVQVHARPEWIELTIDGEAAEDRTGTRVDLDACLARCIIEAHGGEVFVDPSAEPSRAARVTLPRVTPE